MTTSLARAAWLQLDDQVVDVIAPDVLNGVRERRVPISLARLVFADALRPIGQSDPRLEGLERVNDVVRVGVHWNSAPNRDVMILDPHTVVLEEDLHSRNDGCTILSEQPSRCGNEYRNSGYDYVFPTVFHLFLPVVAFVVV
jgi:hypothetical protein